MMTLHENHFATFSQADSNKHPDSSLSILLTTPFPLFLSTSSWDLRLQSILFFPACPDISWSFAGGAAQASNAALCHSDC